MKGVARVPLRLYARTLPGMRAPGRGLRVISRGVPRARAPLRAGGLPRLGTRPLTPLARTVGATASGADEVEEITEHPYLDALDCPCPDFDGRLLLMYLTACLDAVGSAYLYPVRPSPGGRRLGSGGRSRRSTVMPMRGDRSPDRGR